MSKAYITEPALIGHPFIVGFGDENMEVKKLDRENANTIIRQNHYSRKTYSGSIIHLGVYYHGNLAGVLQYGYAMNPASISNLCAGSNQENGLELNRMWLADSLPPYTKSKAISYSIKIIKGIKPKVKYIQSFADARCGKNGIVYQAANFQYYGEFTSTFWELDGVMYHNIIMTAKRGKGGSAAKELQARKEEATPHEYRQFRYIYWIDPRWRKRCTMPEKEYPKWYNEGINAN